MRSRLARRQRRLLLFQRGLLLSQIGHAGRILLMAAALQILVGRSLIGRAASLVDLGALGLMLLDAALARRLGFAQPALGCAQAAIQRSARLAGLLDCIAL